MPQQESSRVESSRRGLSSDEDRTDCRATRTVDDEKRLEKLRSRREQSEGQEVLSDDEQASKRASDDEDSRRVKRRPTSTTLTRSEDCRSTRTVERREATTDC